MDKHFVPLDKDEEQRLLAGDRIEFEDSQAYLAPLIEDALALFAFSQTDYESLRQELLSTVPVAARRFLNNPSTLAAPYKFSTYFTWYISQAIDRYFHIRRAA
jgi:hypothetical protein